SNQQFGWETTEVDSNGNATIHYPLGDDFFEKFHGEDFIYTITFESSNVYDELADAYGEKGEDFIGPFVYHFDADNQENNKLLVPIQIRVGDDETEYPI